MLVPFDILTCSKAPIGNEVFENYKIACMRIKCSYSGFKDGNQIMQLTFEFPRGLIIVISLACIEREARIEICLHLGTIYDKKLFCSLFNTHNDCSGSIQTTSFLNLFCSPNIFR